MEIEKISLEEVDSTNTWAKNNAFKFDPKKLTIISAEMQTCGKGRAQRSWFSPNAKNIYATFHFCLPKPSLHMNCIGQILALSFSKILLKENLHPQIKWPNDVLLNKKKCAGVLCETQFQNDTVEFFLGIGINVNMKQDLLSKIDQPATSLYQETDRSWNKDQLLDKLANQFLQDLSLFQEKGFTPFHAQCENLLAFKGQLVTCHDGQKQWSGILHSLSCDGELNLFLPNKEMKTLACGDLSFKK